MSNELLLQITCKHDFTGDKILGKNFKIDNFVVGTVIALTHEAITIQCVDREAYDFAVSSLLRDTPRWRFLN